MIHRVHLIILPLLPQKNLRDRDICLTRNKSAYHYRSNVPPQPAVFPYLAIAAVAVRLMDQAGGFQV